MFINGIGEDQNLPGADYLFSESGQCDYRSYSTSKKGLMQYEGGQPDGQGNDIQYLGGDIESSINQDRSQNYLHNQSAFGSESIEFE